MTVGEPTKLFGLPKSTVQRTLVTLNEAGRLRANRKDATRWEVGTRVLAVRPPCRTPGCSPPPTSRWSACATP